MRVSLKALEDDEHMRSTTGAIALKLLMVLFPMALRVVTYLFVMHPQSVLYRYVVPGSLKDSSSICWTVKS